MTYADESLMTFTAEDVEMDREIFVASEWSISDRDDWENVVTWLQVNQ